LTAKKKKTNKKKTLQPTEQTIHFSSTALI